MNKNEKLMALGVICGIVSCSKANENLNEDFQDFILWVKERIEEEKDE